MLIYLLSFIYFRWCPCLLIVFECKFYLLKVNGKLSSLQLLMENNMLASLIRLFLFLLLGSHIMVYYSMGSILKQLGRLIMVCLMDNLKHIFSMLEHKAMGPQLSLILELELVVKQLLKVLRIQKIQQE